MKPILSHQVNCFIMPILSYQANFVLPNFILPGEWKNFLWNKGNLPQQGKFNFIKQIKEFCLSKLPYVLQGRISCMIVINTHIKILAL